MKKIFTLFLICFLMPVYAHAVALTVTTTTDKPTYARSQQVKTTALFKLSGVLRNPASTPRITIKDPAGTTRVNAASMTRTTTGTYTYTYTLSSSAAYGTWTDTCSVSGTDTGTGSVTFAVAAPDTTAPVTTASPLGGSYTGAQTVTLTRNEAGTTYYTTNGTTPTTSSAVYTAPLNIASTTTLKYFSRDTAGNNESVKTQVYTITVNGHAGLTWTGYAQCSSCHNSQAQAMYQSVHYQWKGSAAEWTTGPATQGKMDALDGSSALNAYCINIQGSWGPCAACHIGTGAKPVATATPDAAQLASIDCLICHNDTVNAPYSRVRNATSGLFEPAAGLDMNLVLQKANIKPVRANCLGCHAKAGGGDAVKRGDIALANGTTSDTLYDTHMAKGNGGDIKCQGCHKFTAHRVSGRGSDIRPEDSTVEATCATATCHPTKQSLTSSHTTTSTSHHVSRVACQTCHIPIYAKNASDTTNTEATETNRDWRVSEWNATLNRYEPTPTKANNLIPRYAHWNGTSWGNNAGDLAVLDATTGAYKISRPNGAINDPAGTKLYPFKYKTANQPLANGKLVTPKVATYFATGVYDSAVQDGLTYMGMPGAPYTTVTTDEYQVLNHQVPTSAGNVLACSACHPYTTATRINLKNMGYAAKKPLSDLCNDCHSLKTYTPSNWNSFHQEHHESRSYDCSNCHNFSRSGEY
jgi:hypothetical protein